MWNFKKEQKSNGITKARTIHVNKKWHPKNKTIQREQQMILSMTLQIMWHYKDK